MHESKSKQTGMHCRQLFSYCPPAGTSVHVAQLISFVENIWKSFLPSTIGTTYVLSFFTAFLSLAFHVTQPLIICLHNGAVEPSDVGQSPLSCKSVILQSRWRYWSVQACLSGAGVTPIRQRPKSTADFFIKLGSTAQPHPHPVGPVSAIFAFNSAAAVSISREL